MSTIEKIKELSKASYLSIQEERGTVIAGAENPDTGVSIEVESKDFDSAIDALHAKLRAKG